MRVGILTLTLAALGAAPARADQASRVAEARRHHEEGNRYFNLAEYDKAIAEFKDAYHLSDKPGFLFNIAQAYRLKGDCAMALRFYQNYLRLEPNNPNRATIDENVVAMKECVAKTQPAGVPEAPASAPPPAAAPPKAPPAVALGEAAPSPAPRRHLFPAWSPWVTLGVGVAAAGAGTYFGLRTLDPEVSDDAAASAATRANVSFALSGAFVLGGAAMFVW